MDKKGQGVGVMITILVVVIIGMVSLQVIFSQVTDQTTTTAITNDEFTANNGTCVRVTTECILAGTATVANLTTDATGNFTECGSGSQLFGLHLNEDSEGNHLDDQVLNSSYTRQSCGFISDGLTRTVINNYAVFFAVAMLAFVAGFVVLSRN